MTKQELLTAIDNAPSRSAWKRGVKKYAYDLVDGYDGEFDELTTNPRLCERRLLNGAQDWAQYSWGGCAFCYNGQIAQALCAPWELKRTKNGALRPNRHEEWLDVQARALYQAARLILDIIYG